ncbi:MAG: hypothetical protein EZS28_041511 [Streblomastix strix]|uniref:Uncharacterized protein n=1 Tax=Streblomastix strix TaxID=222440 RepID=A0A5J4TYY9_9EUKA|nr:MAG: hypothetical protein EZS28_041511 [Streblomastix strix]
MPPFVGISYNGLLAGQLTVKSQYLVPIFQILIYLAVTEPALTGPKSISLSNQISAIGGIVKQRSVCSFGLHEIQWKRTQQSVSSSDLVTLCDTVTR